MIDPTKPKWLLEMLASAAEREPNEHYIRSWVVNHNAQLDKERGPQQPLTDEDNAEIERILDKDRRGPLI